MFYIRACTMEVTPNRPSSELQLAKKSTCYKRKEKKRAKSFFFPVPSKPLSHTISPLVDVPCLFYCVYEVDEVMGECADGGILKSLLLNRPPSNFSLSTFKVRWDWISVLKHWGAASIETEISLSRPCVVFLWTVPGACPPVHTQRDKKAEK